MYNTVMCVCVCLFSGIMKSLVAFILLHRQFDPISESIKRKLKNQIEPKAHFWSLNNERAKTFH